MPDTHALWQWLNAALRAELGRRAVRGSLVTLAGSLARLAVGLFVARLLAQGLGPGNLGTFYVVSAAVLMLGTIGDAGLSPTAVRQIARLAAAEPHDIAPAAGAFLLLKLAAAALVTAIVFVLAQPLGEVWLHLPGGALLLRLAVLALLTTALSGWASFVAQGLRRLGWVAISQAGTALAGLAAFGALWWLGRFNVAGAVAVGVITPLAGFALLLPALRGQAVQFRDLRRHARLFLGFSGWMWISAMLSITVSQLDLLLVNRWSTAEAVGYYGLAARLALSADLINQSNYVALLPAVSAQTGAAQHASFMRASLRRTVPLALLMLLGAFLAAPLIVWYFGADYAPSVTLFELLMLPVAFDLVTTPLILVAFPLNMPRTLAASDALRVITLAVAATLLVPALGPAGAAWAKLAAKMVGALFTLAMVARRMRDMRREGAEVLG